jgi:hypothetical protein
MHKGQEGTNVKARYVFSNDSMKMCFEQNK